MDHCRRWRAHRMRQLRHSGHWPTIRSRRPSPQSPPANVNQIEFSIFDFCRATDLCGSSRNRRPPFRQPIINTRRAWQSENLILKNLASFTPATEYQKSAVRSGGYGGRVCNRLSSGRSSRYTRHHPSTRGQIRAFSKADSQHEKHQRSWSLAHTGSKPACLPAYTGTPRRICRIWATSPANRSRRSFCWRYSFCRQLGEQVRA